jgi:hypothetical protein
MEHGQALKNLKFHAVSSKWKCRRTRQNLTAKGRNILYGLWAAQENGRSLGRKRITLRDAKRWL